MKPGHTVLSTKTKYGKDIVIRYPLESDLLTMTNYVNALSKERTFITFQGEEISIEQEKQFLNSQLDKISKKQAVFLLVYFQEYLIGIAGIDMQTKTFKHQGCLGISVSKDFRGEGIGSLLMKTVIDESIQNIPALEIISLNVFSNNHVGKKLYEKFGFLEYGYLPKGIKLESGYVDNVFMYKLLQK